METADLFSSNWSWNDQSVCIDGSCIDWLQTVMTVVHMSSRYAQREDHVVYWNKLPVIILCNALNAAMAKRADPWWLCAGCYVSNFVVLTLWTSCYLPCCSANTAVADSPFQISQEDAKAEVNSVSRWTVFGLICS